MPAYGRSGYWTPHIGAVGGYVNRFTVRPMVGPRGRLRGLSPARYAEWG